MIQLILNKETFNILFKFLGRLYYHVTYDFCHIFQSLATQELAVQISNKIINEKSAECVDKELQVFSF